MTFDYFVFCFWVPPRTITQCYFLFSDVLCDEFNGRNHASPCGGDKDERADDRPNAHPIDVPLFFLGVKTWMEEVRLMQLNDGHGDAPCW